MREGARSPTCGRGSCSATLSSHSWRRESPVTGPMPPRARGRRCPRSAVRTRLSTSWQFANGQPHRLYSTPCGTSQGTRSPVCASPTRLSAPGRVRYFFFRPARRSDWDLRATAIDLRAPVIDVDPNGPSAQGRSPAETMARASRARSALGRATHRRISAETRHGGAMGGIAAEQQVEALLGDWQPGAWLYRST